MNFANAPMLCLALLLVPQLTTCITIGQEGSVLNAYVGPVASPQKGLEGNGSILYVINGQAYLISDEGVDALGSVAVDGLAAANGQIVADSSEITPKGNLSAGDVEGALGASLKNGSIDIGGNLKLSNNTYGDLDINIGKEITITHQGTLAGTKVVDINLTSDASSLPAWP